MVNAPLWCAFELECQSHFFYIFRIEAVVSGVPKFVLYVIVRVVQFPFKFIIIASNWLGYTVQPFGEFFEQQCLDISCSLIVFNKAIPLIKI